MANGPAEQISISRALARLAVAKAFRRTCTITHRGGATITGLFCYISGDEDRLFQDANGIVTEQRVLTITVTANQPGFQFTNSDLETVVVGDLVTVSKYPGRTYSVASPIDLDVGGRVYTINIVENKRLGTGVG